MEEDTVQDGQKVTGTPVAGTKPLQFYSKAAESEFFDAGPVTIGVEYRLFFVRASAAHPADTLVDAGISVYVFDKGADPSHERLRFDCLLVHPHYHYIDRVKGTDGQLLFDTVANGDPFQWTLERLRTRLPAMLAKAGAVKLARAVDARAVEAVLPRIAGMAERLREQALASWHGPVHWIGAQTQQKFLAQGFALLLRRTPD